MNDILTQQLLVLGAGLDKSGSPGPQTHQRAEKAFHFYEEYGLKTVVFSGGHPLMAPQNRQGSSEAKVMADIAVNLGLPTDLVKLEEDSTTMLSNFVNSRQLLGPEPVGIVVHSLQAPRALLTAKHLLPLQAQTVEIPEPHEGFRDVQERFLLWLAHRTLADVTPEDLDLIRQKQQRLERAGELLAPLLRRTILRKHEAL